MISSKYNKNTLPPFLEQRWGLGVSPEFNEKPVLRISVSRGIYSTKKTEDGKTSFINATHANPMVETLDLSETEPNELIAKITEAVNNLTAPYNKDDEIYCNENGSREVHADYLVGLMYLPPLDKDGRDTTNKGSVTYAVDYSNLSSILDHFADFMKEKGHLSKFEAEALKTIRHNHSTVH